MTTDHACLPDPGWTARAIACLTWMRTAFATNPKSRAAWMTSACNYNASATEAGYCAVFRIRDTTATVIALPMRTRMESATLFEVDGCSDSSACNYDAAATDDDGSCVFAGSGLDCAGNCLFDVDADGVCDQSEVTGCLDDIRVQLQRLCYGSGLLRVFRIRDTAATVIALPMRTPMESATRLK